MQSAHGKHMRKAYPAKIQPYLARNGIPLPQKHGFGKGERIALQSAVKKRRKILLFARK